MPARRSTSRTGQLGQKCQADLLDARGGYKTDTMTDHDDPSALDPLTAALEAVTRDMARRMAVNIDRLVSQAADLANLEERLAALDADLPPLG